MIGVPPEPLFAPASPSQNDLRTFVNREGHKISVTFVDGRPTIPVPPGYVSEAEATSAFADPDAQPDDDPAHTPLGDPDADVRDISDWSVDELEGVLKQQSILDTFAKASVALGGPAGAIAGLGVRAMGRASRNKALEEIEDRLEEDPNSPDRDRLIAIRDQIAGDTTDSSEKRGPLGDGILSSISDAFTNIFGGGKSREERQAERKARRESSDEDKDKSGGLGGFTGLKDMFDGGGPGRSRNS